MLVQTYFFKYVSALIINILRKTFLCSGCLKLQALTLYSFFLPQYMLDRKTEQLTLVSFDERILSHISGFSETRSTHQIFTTTAVSLRTVKKMTSSKVVLASSSVSIINRTGPLPVKVNLLGTLPPPGKKPFLLLLRRPTMEFNYIKAS